MIEEGEKPLRQAEEVFVHMNKDFRVSRNIRAHWFFDHINKEISIDRLGIDNDTGSEMSVIGIVPTDGSMLENIGEEKFCVTENTKIVYISRFYRQVYVLDLSPSVIVADEELGCCIYTKLLDVLKNALESVTKPFTIPGSKILFRPQIYASVIVFVPFLGFEEDLTLINSILLTHENVESTLKEVETKFEYLKKQLYIFSQPVMRKWAQIRRRHKNRLDSTCRSEAESESSDSEPPNYQTKQMTMTIKTTFEHRLGVSKSVLAIPKRMFDCEQKPKNQKAQPVEAKEEGYIIPELALLFMLRLGLTVVQTMPENTQSNVILITDGVAGMPAPESLQEILRELRSYTVSCSFIEIKGKSVNGPCFGHVCSMDLFHFLSTATFGSYLPKCKCVEIEHPSNLPEDFKPLNHFHRGLLCWSFQNALLENKHIAETIASFNPTFSTVHKRKRDYEVQKNTRHFTTLKELLYVRLREGFTVRKVQIANERIQVDLSLPYRPNTFLQYGINAPWPSNNQREYIIVDLAVVGPEAEIRDLKTSKQPDGVYKANALRAHLLNSLEDACRRISQADTILIHIHSFNTNPAYYSTPERNAVRTCFYHLENQEAPRAKNILVENFFPRAFEAPPAILNFWNPVLNMTQEDWQKWVHVHIERGILRCPLKRGRDQVNDVQFSFGQSKGVLLRFLYASSSFCLIRDELFIVFVQNPELEVPSFFYMIRLEASYPYFVLKIAFLGGICSSERRKLVDFLREKLEKLHYRTEGGFKLHRAVTVIRRPLERILIQYDKMPQTCFLARWTVHSEEDNPDKPLRVEHERHNAITKYLEGRRHIWKIPTQTMEFPWANLGDMASEEIKSYVGNMAVSILLHRRIEERFKLAWTKNKIVGLCRQLEVNGRLILEQYIIFDPVEKRSLRKKGKEKSVPGLLLMAEFWREPCLHDPSDSQAEREEKDDDLVVCLYTLNHLISICEMPKEKARSFLRQSIVRLKNTKMSTSRVAIMDDPFNLHTLLKHSRRMVLYLPTFEIAGDTKGEIRNSVFSTSFFAEFPLFSHAYLDIEDPTVFAMILTQLLKDKGETNRINMDQAERQGYDDQFKSRCRLFMRNEQKTCIMLFVPTVDVFFKGDGTKWPTILATADESLILYSFIRDISNNSVHEYVLPESGKLKDFPEEFRKKDFGMDGWLRTRSVRFIIPNNRQISLRPIVFELRESIMERVTVSSMFKCLKLGKGDCINEKVVSKVLDELCEYTDMELDSTAVAFQSFCDHLHGTAEPNTICDCATLQSIFNNVLRVKNFSPIPADPRYFYYNPGHIRERKLIEDDLKRKPKPIKAFPCSQWSIPEHVKRMAKSLRPPVPGIQEECPLFITFFCALKLPGGSDEYFPVTYFPSCVNQVLKDAKIDVAPEDLKKVKASIFLYIMSWPKSKVELMIEDENEKTDFTKRSWKFISKLPMNERNIMKETLSFLGHSLQLEVLLMDCSKMEEIDSRMLKNISHFITQAVGKDFSDIMGKIPPKNQFGIQVRQRYRILKFVSNQEEGIKKLLNRLDGKEMEYCILKRAAGTKMFYIRKTKSPEAFEKYRHEAHLKKPKISGSHPSQPPPILTRTESESTIEQLHPGCVSVKDIPGITKNFFLLLRIDVEKENGKEDTKIMMQFCERFAAEPSMSRIYLSTWQELRTELRKINQELLLESMFVTRNCSPLLITMAEAENFPKKDGHFSEEEEEETVESNLAQTANYDFAPGSLSCPFVWEHWTHVHPRLRGKTGDEKLSEAARIVRGAFEQFTVTNIPNTYVFQGDDGYILYGQLYKNFAKFEAAAKTYGFDYGSITEKVKEKFCVGPMPDQLQKQPQPGAPTQQTTGSVGSTANQPPPPPPEEKSKEEKDKKPEEPPQSHGDYLLFIGFGAGPPPESVKQFVAEGLIQKALDQEVLGILVDIYKRNPRALLDPFDVEFLQPEPARPSAIYFFSIPAPLKKCTSAIRHYYHQHMNYFHAEARLRETPLLSGSSHPFRPLYPYPQISFNGQVSNPKYSPVFYVEKKIKEKGKSLIGIALVELRMVNEYGVVDKPNDALLRADTSRHLIPPISKEEITERYKRLTTTTIQELDASKLHVREGMSPFPPEPVDDACGYIQVIVWETGDISLSKLKNILKLIIESSFIDTIMEYGIMNQDIIEATNLYPPPSSPSAITPTKVRTPSSAQKIVSGRKRESTDSSLLSGSQTPVTIDSNKRGSVFTYDPPRRGSNHEVLARPEEFVMPSPRTGEHLSTNFYKYLQHFLDYIKYNNNGYHPESFHRYSWTVRHSVLVPQVINQIENRMKEVLSKNVSLADVTQIFHNVNRGSVENPRYELVHGPLLDEKARDVEVDDPHPEWILLSYCDDVYKDSRRYGYEISRNHQEAPISLLKLVNPPDSKWLYLPNLMPTSQEPFIPRNTLCFMTEHNRTITLCFYNFLNVQHDNIGNALLREIKWVNAKYRLYEHIIEHPLDPVLPPVPEDERTDQNPYIQLIEHNPEQLLDEAFPPEKLSTMIVPVSTEVAQRLFRVRRSYTAQISHSCRVQKTFQIFREMRKEVKLQVYAYQSNKFMYELLEKGETKVAEEQLHTMWGHSRRVHYVQTPVLLSPAWRRKIAQVRRGTADQPPKPKAVPTTASSASTTTSANRSRAGTAKESTTKPKEPTPLPTKPKEEDELFEPCHVKMLHDLTGEYVKYLKTLGLKLLYVTGLSEDSVHCHRYQMSYPQGGRCPPDICLFRQLNHGVLLVRLNFVPPYFIMSVGMWAAPELLLRDQALAERESKRILSDLENEKDTLVAQCHIHSFTYDFHLRMISRYLIHKEVLFPNGYNMSTFLIDFLNYYACRPPSARNCVYEERNFFRLHRNVHPTKVWECFLDKNYEEKWNWKVLRIRVTEEEADPSNTRANEYMLTSSTDESLDVDGYSKICVLLRDRRKKENDGGIHLAQYTILVDQACNNMPMEESRQREGSKKSVMGEFRSVAIPTEEQMNREVDDMLQGIEEGYMPTVEGMTRRRRFSSGSQITQILKSSGDTELSLLSPGGTNPNSDTDNIPVQGDPTLRHRRSAGSSEEGEIPGEKASYIQYISVAQRKLQQLLETTTKDYSENIEEAVSHANKECLREFLWCSVQTIPSPLPQLPKLGTQVRLGNSLDIWSSLRCIQHDAGLHIIELYELVQKESMRQREPRLIELLANTNCARLCRYLAYYFGVVRCRFFESELRQPSVCRMEAPSEGKDRVPHMLRHLLITNPDNPVFFLIRCENETNPDMLILFKKEASLLNYHFASLLDKAFNELVESVTAFLWSDLIYRPPGKAA